MSNKPLADDERATILMGITTLVAQAEDWVRDWAECCPGHAEYWEATLKRRLAIRGRIQSVLTEFASVPAELTQAETREQWLIEQVQRIQREAAERAEPFVRELTQLRNARGPDPFEHDGKTYSFVRPAKTAEQQLADVAWRNMPLDAGARIEEALREARSQQALDHLMEVYRKAQAIDPEAWNGKLDEDSRKRRGESVLKAQQ